MARWHATLLVLALALTLLACGDPPSEPGARVRLKPVEGALSEDAGLHLRPVREPTKTYALVRDPAGGDDAWIAPGAPDGRYLIGSSTGWAMLWVANRPPTLTQTGTPIAVPMGRAGAIHVVARDKTVQRVGAEWHLERRGDDGAWVPVPAEVRQGRLDTMLVVPEDAALRGTVRLSGRMSDERPAAPFELELPGPDRPGIAIVQPARSSHFAIQIGALEDLEEGGEIPCTVTVLGSALDERREIRLQDRDVVLRDLPILRGGLRIRLGAPDEEGLVYEIDAETRGRLGRADLLWLPPAHRAWVLTTCPREVVQVLVRPVHDRRFLLTRMRPMEGGFEYLTGSGEQKWLFRDRSGAWLEHPGHRLENAANAGWTAELAGASPPWEASARLRGRILRDPARGVAVSGPGWRVRLRLVTPDGPIDMPGAWVQAGTAGTFDVSLPPGRWTAYAESPSGSLGPEIEFPLRPGVDATRDLLAEPQGR